MESNIQERNPVFDIFPKRGKRYRRRSILNAKEVCGREAKRKKEKDNYQKLLNKKNNKIIGILCG